MLADFLILLKWWFYLLLIGLVFLPIASRIFGRFFDKGYLFSKVLGLAILSFTVWLLSSFHFVPFERISIIFALGFFLIVIFLIFSGFKTFKNDLRENLRIFIFEELLFFLTLVFWSFIRALRPEIFGLEKFMDFGFINSLLRTKFMPPADMWFAGKTINYYYFGHFVTALLTKLVNIKPAISYNLMIATLFALTFSLTFSLTGNLVHFLKSKLKVIIIAGLISAMLLCFASNFHTITYGAFLPAAKKIGLYQGEVKRYYYPEATRFIGYNPPTNDKTIHEFPSYSFVVSDLHAHVLDLPFVLTFLALLLVIILAKDYENKPKKGFLSLFKIPPLYILTALMLGVIYLTSIWDAPIYLLLTGAVLVYKKRKYQPILLDLFKILLLFFIFTLPFNLHSKSLFQGLALVSLHTPLYQFFILWGDLLIVALLFVIFQIRKPSQRLATDIFVLILIGTAIVLLVIPEIIYVKDIYDIDYQRANTMFKLTYQAYLMLTISVGYIAVRLISAKFLKAWLLLLLFGLLIILPLIYPFYSIPRFYRGISFSRYQGLDGLNFLKKDSPSDLEAINWLNKLPGQPIILEADGESYTAYGRISMATGLPTVFGWRVHEWLWRNNYPLLEKRMGDVKEIYESGDVGLTEEKLQKYGVRYVVIGNLERQKYQVNVEKFLSFGKIVFSAPETKIIELSN